jgi:hypothetical protein
LDPAACPDHVRSVGQEDLGDCAVVAFNIADELGGPPRIRGRIVRRSTCCIDEQDAPIVRRSCRRPELPVSAQGVVLGIPWHGGQQQPHHRRQKSFHASERIATGRPTEAERWHRHYRRTEHVEKKAARLIPRAVPSLAISTPMSKTGNPLVR